MCLTDKKSCYFSEAESCLKKKQVKNAQCLNFVSQNFLHSQIWAFLHIFIQVAFVWELGVRVEEGSAGGEGESLFLVDG